MLSFCSNFVIQHLQNQSIGLLAGVPNETSSDESHINTSSEIMNSTNKKEKEKVEMTSQSKFISIVFLI